MAFFEVNVKLMNTVLIILGIVLVVGFLAVVAYKMARTNADAKRKALQQTEDQNADVNPQLILAKNVIYNVGIDGEIAAGTYVLKSATTAHSRFNIRINGLVSKCSDGETIVLDVGDTICVVSSSAVLLPSAED